MSEKQLKYQNKVKIISFIFMVAGLLLVLLWSIKKNEQPAPQTNTRLLTINYTDNGVSNKYDYTCKNDGCVLSSQGGMFAIVKDGSYHLINLTNKSDKELNLTMTKNFLVADTEFYGLVYTKTDTNAATFYEMSKEQNLFEDELNYESMNNNDVKTYLTKLYQRGLFYTIKDTKGEIVNINTNEVVLEDVTGLVVDDTELYIVSSKGVSSFESDNTLKQNLTDAKKVFPSIFEHQFVIQDSDDYLKLATLSGTKGDKLVEVGNGVVESVKITNGIMEVIIQDQDYATNQKTYKYEYDFVNKKLTPIA